MKAKDLQNKSSEELQKQLGALQKDQFKFQMQKATGQLAQTHVLGQTRRDIARVKTALNNKAGN